MGFDTAMSGDRLRPRPSPARHAFLYDGGCGLCKKAAAIGRRLDWLGQIDFMDAVHDWPRISKKFPFLNQDACLTDIHLVAADGKVFTRFAAYRRAMWVLPIFWLTLPLMFIPPVPQIADRIYGYVARHRHDHGCAI